MPETFGEYLRALRIAAGHSMGHMARLIGVSVVYWSDVENCRRLPFPVRDNTYNKLAKALGHSAVEIADRALRNRDRIEIDLRAAQPEQREVLLSLARRLDLDPLAPDEVERIRRILDKTEAKE